MSGQTKAFPMVKRNGIIQLNPTIWMFHLPSRDIFPWLKKSGGDLWLPSNLGLDPWRHISANLPGLHNVNNAFFGRFKERFIGKLTHYVAISRK